MPVAIKGIQSIKGDLSTVRGPGEIKVVNPGRRDLPPVTSVRLGHVDLTRSPERQLVPGGRPNRSIVKMSRSVDCHSPQQCAVCVDEMNVPISAGECDDLVGRATT